VRSVQHTDVVYRRHFILSIQTTGIVAF
jgi:hypothetical protein